MSATIMSGNKISGIKLGAAALAGVALMAATTAPAITLQAVYTGTVSSGLDAAGIFGPTTGDLTGETFVARFVYETTVGHRVTTPGSGDYIEGGTDLGIPSPILGATLTIGGVTVHVSPAAYGAQEVDLPTTCCQADVYSEADSPERPGIQTRDTFYIEAFGTGSDSIDTAIPQVAVTYQGLANFFRLDANTGGVLNSPIGLGGAGTVAVSAVPEPSSWLLMLMGIGSVGAASRRLRRGTAVA